MKRLLVIALVSFALTGCTTLREVPIAECPKVSTIIVHGVSNDSRTAKFGFWLQRQGPLQLTFVETRGILIVEVCKPSEQTTRKEETP